MAVDPDKLEHEQQGHHQHAGVDLAPAAGARLHHAVGDEAHGDPLGDGEAERHHDGGHEGRHRFGQVFPLHPGQLGAHQHTHIDEGPRRRIGRHHGGNRGEEDRQQEQQADHDGGQTGTAADGDAGAALDEGGDRGGAHEGAADGAGAIHQQGLLHAREVTLVIGQLGAVGDADQGAGGVEQVDQHKGEDDSGQADVERPHQIQLAEHRLNAGGHGDEALEGDVAKQPAQGGGHYDGDQHGGVDAAGREDADQEEAEQPQQAGQGGEVAHRHHGRGAGHHYAGVVQAEQGDQEADAGGDADPQGERNIGDEPVAHPQQGEDQQAHGAPEDGAHAHLPGVAHAGHHHEGEEGVEAHGRCQRNGQVGEQAHQDAADAGDEAGGNEHGLGVHAGRREDLRVDEDDVDHGQEGGDAGDHFGAGVGAMALQGKQTLKQSLPGGLCGGLVWLIHVGFQ